MMQVETPTTPAAEQDASLVEEFLGHAFYTGQENADKGNESPAAFFEQTIDFLEFELQQLDLQITREDDPDEKLELQKSREELGKLDDNVRTLAKTLVSVATRTGGTKQAMQQILVHGVAVFGEIKQATDKSKARLRHAIATDGPAAAELLAAKKRALLQQGETVGIMGSQTDLLMIALTLIMNLSSDVSEAAAEKRNEVLEKFTQNATRELQGLPLTAEEIQYLASKRAQQTLAQHEELLAYHGEQRPVDLYNQFAHQQIQQLLANAPAGMRLNEAALNNLLALSAFDQSMLTQLETVQTTEQIRPLSLQLEAGQQNVEALSQSVEDYRRQVELTGHLLIVAQNDIERAMMGEPLNTGAISQLFSSGEVSQIRDAVEERREHTPKWPSEDMMRQVEGLYNQMVQNIAPQERGFDIGSFNSFANRVKPS